MTLTDNYKNKDTRNSQSYNLTKTKALRKIVNTQAQSHTHTVILCYLDQHFKREDACENVVKITQHLQSNTTK